MKRPRAIKVTFHAPLRSVETTVRASAPTGNPAEDTVAESPSEAGEASETFYAQQVLAMLEQIAKQLDERATVFEHQLGEMQALIVELAVAVASHVVKQKLDRDELSLDEIVRSAIDQMGVNEELTVKVNPRDREQLESMVSDSEPGRRLGQVELIGDGDMPRGACLVLGDEGGLLSSFESRLENVRETLLQGIAYARNEPPQAVDVGGAVRRFSDRRTPA